MEIVHTQYKHSDVIKPNGRVDSATSPQFEDSMQAVISKNRYNLVVDMSGIEFISSAGLRVLISSQKKCREKNGDVVLAAPSDKIRATLELAGFHTLFSIYTDLISAVGNI
jgi:anti-sigma B factor antagonist